MLDSELFHKLFFFWGPVLLPRLFLVEIWFWTLVGSMALLTILSKVSTFFAAIHTKMLMVIDGLCTLLVGKDPQWVQPPDWTNAPNIQKESSKRVVFIRHGESVWNEIFNRGLNVGFIGRLIKGFVREILFLHTPYSVLFDTPLNHEGIQQAVDLSDKLKTLKSDNAFVNETVSLLRGDSSEPSIIVCSNLRRALATLGIGLWERLDKTGERILIHSACQEISRNIDCLASAEAGATPAMDGKDSGDAAAKMAHPRGGKYKPEAIFNPALNAGHKSLYERGTERLQAFSEWAFTRPESTIVVGGHSLWFRNFFRYFLGRTDKHVGKLQKMQNGACIAFTLNSGRGPSGNPVYWIEPGSIVPIVGDFESKKLKSKDL
jgi:broad specificity phosphatase PhoE